MRDNRKILKKYESLWRYVDRKRISEELKEDFRQYAIEKIIKGRKALFSQLYIDFMTTQYGRIRKKKKTKRFIARYYEMPLNGSGSARLEKEEKKKYFFRSTELLFEQAIVSDYTKHMAYGHYYGFVDFYLGIEMRKKTNV